MKAPKTPLFARSISLSALKFQLSAFILPLLLLSACVSSHPRPLASQYTRENSSRVVSRGPALIDDAEARHLASGGYATSTTARTKSAKGSRTEVTEEVVSSTSTETVVGRQTVAAPDRDINTQ